MSPEDETTGPSEPSLLSKTDGTGPQSVAMEMEVDHEGNTVFVRGTLLPDSVLHPIILVHDFGETAGLYREAAKEFVERGYSTVGFDMRGHGRSGKRLGHFEDYHVLVSDLLQVAAWLRHKSQGRAPIVIAQGMSAAIGIQFQLRFPKICYRLVLTAPVLRFKSGLSRPATLALRTIADVLPKAKVPSSLTPKFLAPIKYGSSELIHAEKPDSSLTYSATYVKEILRMCEAISGKFLRIKSLTLIVRTKEDEINRNEALEELLKRHKRRQFIRDVIIDAHTHNLLTENVTVLASTINVIETWLSQVDQEVHEKPD